MKLNIGSNNIIKEGYVNLDGLDLENVDGLGELGLAPYTLVIKPEKLSKFGDSVMLYPPAGEGLYIIIESSIDEILAVEFLEHISFKLTDMVLHEWYRILKKGGKVNIQVPDCGKMMEYYMNGEICECVPHKGTAEEQVVDPNCFVCQGKAKVNPNRWLYSFTGAQKHQYDAHLNIFTKDRMFNALEKAGFKHIEFNDDKFKLKVKAIK